MRNKHFKMGVGKYYFTVRNGQNNITISRAKKDEAVNAYLNYINLGKDVNWLGAYNGKNFDDNEAPVASAA